MPSLATRSPLHVDAVLCISLESRADRRALILEQFAGSGLDIEFVLVGKDTDDPQRGCFTSHQVCARHVLERGYRNALILEDDATLERYDPRTIRRINRFLDKTKPELLHLGVILGKMWLTRAPGIARCRAAGAHAYIISRRACEILVTHTYSGLGIDTLYRRMFRQYCVFPMISDQQPERIVASDIADVRQRYAKVGTWRWNTRKQYLQVVGNLWRTVLGVDL